MMDKEVEW